MTPTDADRLAQEQLADRTMVTLRPLAGPLALGFLGLAGASFVVAGLQLGWVEPAEGKKVALVILAFTVPLQLLAAIIGFLARDAVAATGMGLLSGIWASFALVTFTSKPGSTSDALGLFLLLAFVAMLAPATAALSSKLVPALVLGSAAIRFGLGGLHQLTGDEIWENLSGLWGLWLTAVAVYAAYATELEDALKRPVLPFGRRGRGEKAVQGTYAQQIAEVHKEPGVRQQL
jgi:succinate-acetate transporter protein